jgi:hypothetical protein
MLHSYKKGEKMNFFRHLIVLLVFAAIVPATLSQVTSNVFLRILLIKTPSGEGTAFTMDIDGRQYLITAKHVVEGMTGRNAISLRENGSWTRIDVTVFPCADPVDIAILVPPRILTVSYPLESAALSRVTVTQEVFFLGFPFGISAGEHNAAFGPHPVPIGKHGILSAIEDGVLLVDAYNNPGFSGAPIVFRSLYDGGGSPVFYVLGVVKGFYPDLVPVTKPTPVRPGDDVSKIEGWRLQKDANGQTAVLRDTDEKVPLNSGILTGYSIDYAIKMIREHPIGPVVPKS